MPESPPLAVLSSAYFLAQVSGFSLFFKSVNWKYSQPQT